MTQKYLWVRREIYEKNPASKINHNRSISDMVRLFKIPYWIMLAFLMLSAIGLIVMSIVGVKTLLIFLPMIIILVVSIVSQIPREKYFYKDSVRQEELAEMQEKYQLYINELWVLLDKHGINTPEKVSLLKLECEEKLKAHKKAYQGIGKRVFDMFFGVPLGALISSIIYTKSDIDPVSIVSIFFVGFATTGFVKLINNLRFYSDGYFKDKRLLDALNELSYNEKKEESSSYIKSV